MRRTQFNDKMNFKMVFRSAGLDFWICFTGIKRERIDPDEGMAKMNMDLITHNGIF